MGYDEHERNADASEPGEDESLTQDGWNGTDRPSTAIREAVAAATERAPAALSPLDRRIDTGALDSFLSTSHRSGNESGNECMTVSFEYEGTEVTVDTDGGLDVRTAETGSAEPPAEPTTEAELNAMIQQLLQTAYRNGMSVQGGWPARNGPAYPDWDVLVTRVTKPRDANSHGRT